MAPMVGEWIKWVKGLSRRREVIVMSEALGITRGQVAAACMEWWEWCDDNATIDPVSRNGHALGVTRSYIDCHVGIEGFGAAMEKVGWLALAPEGGLLMPNLGRHNGKSAKERALAAERQRRRRDGKPENVTEMSRSKRDKNVTREEKRRDYEEDFKKTVCGRWLAELGVNGKALDRAVSLGLTPDKIIRRAMAARKPIESVPSYVAGVIRRWTAGDAPVPTTEAVAGAVRAGLVRTIIVGERVIDAAGKAVKHNKKSISVGDAELSADELRGAVYR